MKGTYIRSYSDEDQANVIELLSSYISMQKCNILRDVYVSHCVLHIIAVDSDINK